MPQTIRTAILLLTVSALPASLSAQTPVAAQATGTATPSAILRPALDRLQQGISLARSEKWKAPAAVIAESTTDIASMQRDLDSTLPPLLTAADSASAAVPQLLPAYRNVEALYDVLVRVAQTAVLAAPIQQSTALQQATSSLQQARREFGDLLQSAAQSQDQRLHDMQTQLHTAQNAAPPSAPACPTPPLAAKKAKPRAKAKPATPAATPPPSH